MQPNLIHELSHHQYLRDKLEAEFPDADEETLRDTLEGMTNLTDMLGAVLRSQLDDLALTAALRARIVCRSVSRASMPAPPKSGNW